MYNPHPFNPSPVFSPVRKTYFLDKSCGMHRESAYKYERSEDFQYRSCIPEATTKKRPPRRTFNIDRRILYPIYVVVILAIWAGKLQSVQLPDPAQFYGSLPEHSGIDTLWNQSHPLWLHC